MKRSEALELLVAYLSNLPAAGSATIEYPVIEAIRQASELIMIESGTSVRA